MDPQAEDNPINEAPGDPAQKSRLVRLLTLELCRRARRLGEKSRRAAEELRRV